MNKDRLFKKELRELLERHERDIALVMDDGSDTYGISGEKMVSYKSGENKALFLTHGYFLSPEEIEIDEDGAVVDKMIDDLIGSLREQKLAILAIDKESLNGRVDSKLYVKLDEEGDKAREAELKLRSHGLSTSDIAMIIAGADAQVRYKTP